VSSAVIAGLEPAGHLDGQRCFAIDGRTIPMNDNAFGIRDGEIAIELTAKFDASLYFIGRIRTPWRRREDCPKNARESDAVCTLARSTRAGRRRSRGWRPAATWWCFIG